MRNLPIYNSEKEAFDFLDNKYNYGVPEDIKISWGIIQIYADCCAEVTGQGNSGEFHNEKDAKEAENALNKAEENIINWFASKFGWKPMIAEQSYHFFRLQKNGDKFGTYISEFWKFEKLPKL